MKVLIIVNIVLVALVGLLANFLRMACSNKKEKAAEEQKEKNELKEKIDTGNSKSDFNATLDVLHQLSKR